MKPVRPVHPPLFALYPPLSLYAANVSLIPWQDVVKPAAALLAASLGLWGILALILRDAIRTASAVSVALIAFFAYSTIAFGKPGEEGRFSPMVWMLVIVLLAVAAGWKNRTNRGVATFLNVTGVLLMVMALGSIARSHWTIRGELARTTEEKSATKGTAIPAGMPDIFYIILDGYGRTDTFERNYGFSDKAFVEELEERGFYVAKQARSNYVQTELSLTSTLNLEYLDQIVRPIGNVVEQRMLLDQMIDDSRVSRFLRSKGYLYYAITTGFPALTFRSADVVVEQESGSTLFLNALREKTPFPTPEVAYTSQYDARRFYLEGGYRAIENLAPPGPKPRFVIVHILAPHPPFVFGPKGEPRRPKGPYGFWDGSHFHDIYAGRNDYVTGYREQAQYIAKRTLDAIDKLARTGPRAPIILIQGDHGPKNAVNQDFLEKTDLDEAFGILSAFRVPDSIKAKLYPSISPVNTFRLLLSEMFTEDFPLRDDRHLYSTWGEPLKMVDVSEELGRAQR